MTEGVDQSLELLAVVYPVALKPSDIFQNLKRLDEDPPSRSTIYNAISDLEEHGYIDLDEGMSSEKKKFYRITVTGEQYLEGEIEELELELPDGD